MARKKKQDINVEALNFKPILDETVMCSRLGRTLASFGATLTGREKHNAELVYLLLKVGRELPKSPATAHISSDKKTKKYGYVDAVKWFANKYPNAAEPLLAKLEETYDTDEIAVEYGLSPDRDFSDDNYIKILVDVSGMPQQDAATLYHGTLKPHLERAKQEEGLARAVMK
ncbi:MAG: hypothetical protein AABX73_04045 [Nanoarchaeota archaeon]